MKLLAEISGKSLGLSEKDTELNSEYTLRKSARAIVLNEKGEMATQYLQNYQYHKLPGGGVEDGESLEEALKREVKEEVGCDCEIISSVGMIIEYINDFKIIHISQCFVAKAVGKMGEPKLEEGEIEEGQITFWMKPEEVLHKIKDDQPQKYQGHFISLREETFLTEAINGGLV